MEEAMAKRKAAAQEHVPAEPDVFDEQIAARQDEAMKQQPVQAQAPAQGDEQAPPKKWSRPDPFPDKTVNFRGYKVRLQESRGSRFGHQAQIKFGEGVEKDKPSPEILDFVKQAEGPDGTKFHWNADDRAWGLQIGRTNAIASWQQAERVFAEVLTMVAKARGAPGRTEEPGPVR
jgi:hypothetical protein